MSPSWNLPENRYFDPDPTVQRAALDLYAQIQSLPIISPHGHVDPRLFSDPDATFGTPADLLIIPDHYVFRMLHAQGIPFAELGVPASAGAPAPDPRRIWHIFCQLFHLFRATPSGMWLAYELKLVLGIDEIPAAANADRLYDQIVERLASPEFRPRRVFERFNIEVLATTDPASDPLAAHVALRDSGWKGRVIPTFRPDAVLNLEMENWPASLAALEASSGIAIANCADLLRALANRRAYFKSLGATATDHGVFEPFSAALPDAEAEAIFARALAGQTNPADSARFGAHMLNEMAEMSCADGLVMQIHPGSLRNHNPAIFAQYGRDKGYDIPVQTEYTRSLRPLLARYGEDPRFRLILFTLDETSYARELAPLAGVYPAVRIGPPWWFYDSWNGMRRYFDQVMETAGIYNTAGFNDDTRAFLSIPARHDLWRRATANWLGGLVARAILSPAEAAQAAADLAYHLPKQAYRLP